MFFAKSCHNVNRSFVKLDLTGLTLNKKVFVYHAIYKRPTSPLKRRDTYEQLLASQFLRYPIDFLIGTSSKLS